MEELMTNFIKYELLKNFQSMSTLMISQTWVRSVDYFKTQNPRVVKCKWNILELLAILMKMLKSTVLSIHFLQKLKIILMEKLNGDF